MNNQSASNKPSLTEWIVWTVIMSIAIKQLLKGTVGEFSLHGDGIANQVLYSRFAYFIPFLISIFALWFPRAAIVLYFLSGLIGYSYLRHIQNSFVADNHQLLASAFLPWLGIQAGLAVVIVLIQRRRNTVAL